MIITQLSGGLGNQMFQYAIGRVLSIKNNDILKLDISHYNHLSINETQRIYSLDIFSFTQYFANYIEKKWFETTNKVIIEKNHGFDAKILKIKGSVSLQGYWQSERYIQDDRSIILRDFQFPRAKGINLATLNNISRGQSVSIHVRRGDYVNSPTTKAFHGLCDISYYQLATKYLESKIKDPTYYVFSDDPLWCQANLNLGVKTVYVSHNQGTDSWEDMRLMSHCQHNIIANSSFSWWGAWLNQNPDKIVIAPKKWFRDPSIDTRDLVPGSWTRI